MNTPLLLLVSFALLALASAGTVTEDLEWLAENAKKEGVVVLPSGLQYKVLKAGQGAHKATKSDRVECHYRGTLIGGAEFDSSYSRGQPATFGVTQVIAGWTEALQLMTVGDHWELYIPSELAYGSRGAGGRIGPNRALIFELEILSIPTQKH